MQLDPKSLQLLAIAVLFALLYAGRMVKGSSSQTSEGVAFPLKPIVLWGRGIVLPLYFVLFAWPLWQREHHIPAWLPLLILALVAFVLAQMPGTIILTPTGLIQRFWLRGTKSISYPEVMSIQAIGAGRMTRVLGANRISITHTWNHAGADEFIKELERRTGKRVVR